MSRTFFAPLHIAEIALLVQSVWQSLRRWFFEFELVEVSVGSVAELGVPVEKTGREIEV
jgi:hypothetical protein